MRILSAEEYAYAESLWKSHAPPQAEDLLRARSKDWAAVLAALGWAATTPLGTSRYEWVEETPGYRSRLRPVDPRKVKQSVNTFARSMGKELYGLTEQYFGKGLTFDEWRGEMIRRVKGIHFASSIAVYGGWVQLTPEILDEISNPLDGVEFHLLKFEEFARALPRLTLANATNRATLYGESASITFETRNFAFWNGLTLGNGEYVEVQNVLAADAEHCHTRGVVPGCVGETAKGWVRQSDMSAIGSRVCSQGCKCFIERRKVRP